MIRRSVLAVALVAVLSAAAASTQAFVDTDPAAPASAVLAATRDIAVPGVPAVP